MAVMGVYNAAAWMKRRDVHLAVNAILYTALTIWEQKHVAHHLAELRRCRAIVDGATVKMTTTVEADAVESRIAA